MLILETPSEIADMKELLLKVWTRPLSEIRLKSGTKLMINTINAHSYNLTLDDPEFREALMNSDILLPDGVGVVLANRVILGRKIKKIAGFDLLIYQLNQLEAAGGKCFFLGSKNKVLDLIKQRILNEYPGIATSFYSPSFALNFSLEEDLAIVRAVNSFAPDVLFIGMTAPKQEKWANKHFQSLNATNICSVGAAFDYFAGTVKRSPDWMIRMWMEWFYRLIREPFRLWRRYVRGTFRFLRVLFLEWLKSRKE